MVPHTALHDPPLDNDLLNLPPSLRASEAVHTLTHIYTYTYTLIHLSYRQYIRVVRHCSRRGRVTRTGGGLPIRNIRYQRKALLSLQRMAGSKGRTECADTGVRSSRSVREIYKIQSTKCVSALNLNPFLFSFFLLLYSVLLCSVPFCSV